MSIMPSKMLINTRLLAVLCMGFASGLPLALIGSTLQAWFTASEVNLMAIGWLSFLGFPYVLKFLWAPFMDYYRLEKWGGRKCWILLTQFLLVILLFWLSTLQPLLNPLLIGMVAFFIAFFSASQDIVIDAYRTDLLSPAERGLGAAYYVFAYRIATLLSGGFALFCADYFGWRVTYEMMACLMLLSMIPTYFSPPLRVVLPVSHNLFSTITEGLWNLLQREKIILLLLFVVFYKFGDALALSLITNFLLHGLQFSLSEVGFAYKVVGFIATVSGAFLGGILLIRWNIYRALLLFGLAQAFSNLMFVLLAFAGKHFWLMAFSIFVEGFCSGLSTAAFFAFLMSLCVSQFSAGQFALLSAIASLGRVFLGPLAAFIVQQVGWIEFYIWAFILSFPGLLFLMMLKEEVRQYAEV